MIKQRQKTANRFLDKSRNYSGRSAILLGGLAASLVIAGGRLTLGSTTSSISGWTALLFTAICVGLLCFNLLSDQPFASRKQIVGLILGVLSGNVSILMLEKQLDSAGDAFLFCTGTLLGMSLIGLQQGKAHPQAFQARTLASWALRLDDLLKYDLPTRTRNALTQLIDALWQSPQDHADFIPAQNAVFADSLTQLEIMIRQGNYAATAQTLNELGMCLADRNQLLTTASKIEYRLVGDDRLALPHTAAKKVAINVASTRHSTTPPDLYR